MKIATRHAWATEDGKQLVDDGDVKAAVLVSGKGQVVHPDRITGFKNADDYFEDVNPTPKAEHHTRKRVEDAEPEAKAPQAKKR